MSSRPLAWGLGLAAGGAALAVWWRLFGGAVVRDSVLRADGGAVVGALLLMVAAQGLRLLRWHLLLLRVGTIPLARTFRLLYASELLNSVLPVKVGDLGRAVALQRSGTSFTIGAAIASIAVDRLYGVLARLLTLALLPFVPSSLPPSLQVSIGLFTAILAAAVCSFAVWSRCRERASRLVAPLARVAPARVRGAFGRSFRAFADASVEMGARPALVAALTLLSLGALAAQAAGVALLYRAVGHRLPLAVALVGCALLDLLAIVPAPPAGVGAAEWYGTLVFSAALGQPAAPTAAVALLYHAASLVLVFGAGGLSLGAVGEMWPRRRPAVPS